MIIAAEMSTVEGEENIQHVQELLLSQEDKLQSRLKMEKSLESLAFEKLLYIKLA